MFLPGIGPFALEPKRKAEYLAGQLSTLLEHHRARCPGYARLVEDWQRDNARPLSPENYPFVPVTVFKEYDLRSTSDAVIDVRSSATTSGMSARIAVDKATGKRQNLSATKVLADFIGEKQRPYLVFDLEKTVRGSESMSARGAAILGLAHLASSFHFVMREEDGELVVDRRALTNALTSIGGEPFIAYGFTYLLYQAQEQLQESPLTANAHPDSVFLHSGGWKKLMALAVDKGTFNAAIARPWGLAPANVIDFYGAVEQVGVPYPDCAQGLKHVPYWADVIIRRSDSLEPAPPGETGLLQLMNCLPLSAPNHSVLTEDMGRIVVEDGCGCGRRGKAFEFMGRAPRSEVRGCSDVPRH
jgi:hypothetical protein